MNTSLERNSELIDPDAWFCFPVARLGGCALERFSFFPNP